MTDLDKFIELYDSIGIKLTVDKTDNKQIIEFGAHDNDKLKGYVGFSTTIEFDNEGKFIEQGFWE